MIAIKMYNYMIYFNFHISFFTVHASFFVLPSNKSSSSRESNTSPHLRKHVWDLHNGSKEVKPRRESVKFHQFHLVHPCLWANLENIRAHRRNIWNDRLVLRFNRYLS